MWGSIFIWHGADVTIDDPKKFYTEYHDRIFAKRFNSTAPIRRRVHRAIYKSVLDHVQPGMRILDVGCGEGILSIMMARKGANVTGVDCSVPNVENAVRIAAALGPFDGTLSFRTGDAERLPFPDDSFDYVVSNHVLEHLSDFGRGLSEIHRVTKKGALIAVPTCLNPCAWALLGNDKYWRFSQRSPIAVPLGLLRVGLAALTGRDGVDEGYGADKNNTHIFRFPSVARRRIVAAGFRVVETRAQAVCLPYLDLNMDLARNEIFRHAGLGTLYVVEKR